MFVIIEPQDGLTNHSLPRLSLNHLWPYWYLLETHVWCTHDWLAIKLWPTCDRPVALLLLTSDFIHLKFHWKLHKIFLKIESNSFRNLSEIFLNVYLSEKRSHFADPGKQDIATFWKKCQNIRFSDFDRFW